MSPNDPGASAAAADDAGSGASTGSARPGNGASGSGNGSPTNGGNGGKAGNGGGGVRTVVPTRAELLLVAAERQLAKEAAARGGTVRLRPAPRYDDAGDDAWVEEVRPRRRVVTVVDPDDLDRGDRRALGKLKARKVRRIVRHVSPWSVFKVSILFYLCLWLILLVSGVILWRFAQQGGVIENIGKFWAKATGEKYVDIDGRGVFRAMAGAGAILVFAATGFTLLMTVLFNLITDLVGGVRMTVIELERTKREVRRKARSLDEARRRAAEGSELVVEDVPADEPVSAAGPAGAASPADDGPGRGGATTDRRSAAPAPGAEPAKVPAGALGESPN